MKRFILFLLAFAAYQCVEAQITDAGLSLGMGITRLRNINTSGRRPGLNPEISLAPMIGFHAAHFFTHEIAIEAEADYALVNQKYNGDFAGTSTFDAKDELSYFEIPVLFEYTQSNIYAEIGPKLSVLAGATGKMEMNPSSSDDYSNMNISNGFSNLVLSGVVGSGARFKMGENLILQAGIRIAYSFTDATKQFPPDEYYSLSVKNKLGITSKYAHLAIGSNNYDYRATKLITGNLLVSLCYHFPERK